MKHTIKMISLVIVSLAIVFISGCSNNKPTPTVGTFTEIKDEVKVVEAFGTVVVKDIKNLNIDFPAFVTEVYVDEGQKVKKGDILISLDMSEVTGMLEEKRLALEVAKKELQSILVNFDLDKLQNTLSQKKNTILKEKKELKRLEDELQNFNSPTLQKLLYDIKVSTEIYEREKAELEVRRNLLKEQAISQQAFDEFKKITEQKKHEVKSLELSLAENKYQRQLEVDNLKFSISTREKSISNLEIEIKKFTYNQEQSYFAQNAKVEQLENEVRQLESKLSKNFIQDNNIVANVAEGIVYNIGYVSGEPVVSQKSLLSLKDLHLVLVKADVPEEFIKDIAESVEAVIIPLADTSRKYHGQVISISRMAIRKGGETVVPIEISINDLDEFLLENFNVDIEITKK
ncbi:MAG: biotin/lipoyl-binding protein [Halanaerobiales bacterium]|nr:biotin/lipoyl-binding protein [Halanaerobiales bacterium]